MNTNEETKGMCCGGVGEHHCWKKKAAKGVYFLGVSGSLLLLAMFASEVKGFPLIGRDVNAQTTISVSGDGEAFAAPDIATVSFSITQKSKTSLDSRKVVDEKMAKIEKYLTDTGVEKKDIKTTGYNLYPTYNSVRKPCLWENKMEYGAPTPAYPCYDTNQVLTGYEVTESVEVKIRNLDDAGKILGGLTENGATNVSGLNFMVENEDAVQASAREKAITKAKTKAEKLAKDLGVSLVRIVSFNEGGVYPTYYSRGAEMKLMAADAAVPAQAPVVSPGENKYTSNVTIVYEIR